MAGTDSGSGVQIILRSGETTVAIFFFGAEDRRHPFATRLESPLEYLRGGAVVAAVGEAEVAGLHGFRDVDQRDAIVQQFEEFRSRLRPLNDPKVLQLRRIDPIGEARSFVHLEMRFV